MFSSPNPVIQSPILRLGTESVGHADGEYRFTDSPSDSRVPRTPNVQRCNKSRDQSVPLTPLGQRALVPNESPGNFNSSVPCTPDRNGTALIDQTRSDSLIIRVASSPFASKSRAHSSTPTVSDQRVPTTPVDNLGKISRCEPFFGALFSPVPHTYATLNHQEVIDLMSPMHPSSFIESPNPKSTSSFLEQAHTNDESGYASFSKAQASNDSSREGKEKMFNVTLNEFAEDRRTFAVSLTSEQSTRKCPPRSRRRLSLCKQGQQDLPLRKAHNSVTTQRLMRASSQTTSTLEITSGNDDDILTPVEEKAAFNGLTSVVRPLTSPAGDAPFVKTKNVTKQIKETSSEGNVLNAESTAHTSNGSTSSTPCDLLDLINNDGVFDV